MNVELKPLPYPMDALEPHVSARTLEFHYGKHHAGYVEKLRGLVEGKPEAELDILDLVRRAPKGPIFNNAAQVLNHDIYWRSMRKGGGGEPRGEIGNAIDARFGGAKAFREAFERTAMDGFGSGYVWLWLDGAGGKLELGWMKDAENPVREGYVPILCMDMWEHAYYLDRQNDKKSYVQAFLASVIDWSAADEHLKAARDGRVIAHASR